MPWARRVSKRIPPISSTSREFPFSDYIGMNTFSGNDRFPEKKWRLAQNARITDLGEYETRKALDFLSDAIGETQDQAETSTTGAADRSFGNVTRLAQKWTAGTSGRLSKVEVRLKNDASATGTVIVEHWSDSSGSPGTLVARSSIASSTLTSSYAYITARFVAAPQVTATTAYWVVVYSQTIATGSYKWSSTSNATTAKTSTNSGSTWSSTSYALNFKTHYATDAAPKGGHYARKSDGTTNVLIAAGTVLYSINLSTGAVSSIKTGLNASATHYRFVTVNDIVYYVNGYDGLRKWNFSTESQVSSTNYTHITEHKGLLFLVDKNDPSKLVFSNFAAYETFTSTDFVYVPSPKTGDPITALASLNGALVIPTLQTKWMLHGSDNATFFLQQAPGQKSTFTQETVAVDNNFMYFLSDDGIYSFNGTEDKLISADVYEDLRVQSSKSACALAINKGRLYVFVPDGSNSYNSLCWVFNLALDCVESKDTDAFVSRGFTAFGDNDKFIVISSLIGQVYYQEMSSNDYTNLGDDIDFRLQTHHMGFGSPMKEKDTRYWAGSLSAQSGAYSVTLEYATDLSESWQSLATVDVQGSGSTWGSATWGSFTWGTSAEKTFSRSIPGSYRRLAIGYKHYATRQPQKFFSHTFVVQTRRQR